MGIVCRQARPADIDRIVEIHSAAFPDARGDDARRTQLLHAPWQAGEPLFLAERDGIIVAHAALYALESWFGGKRVRVGGIASVGVAPEARGTGTGRALLAEVHARSHARGDALTMLYPFRQGYYRRFGYVPVTPSRRLGVAPQSIPRIWSADAAGCVVRAATPSDRVGVEGCYRRTAERRTGWLSRPAAIWDYRFANPRLHWFVAVKSDVVVGALAYELLQWEPHAATRGRVSDLIADDAAVRRRLFALLAAQRDQVTEFELDVDFHDPIDRAFSDPDGARFGTIDLEHPLGTLVGGPMVRIHDVDTALASRGYATDGALVVEVEEMARRVELVVTDGHVEILATKKEPDVRTTTKGLASIAYGALLPSDAARIGFLGAKDAAALGRADALLALRPFFAIDPF